MKIAPFEMERYQSRYWHQVDHDLSESGVLPMTIRELLGPTADAEGFLHTALGYPLSEGSLETRASIAAWYPGASPEEVSITNGGSEANFLTLFSLLGSGDRLAFMVPNYLQGRGLGKAFGKATDTYRLKPVDGRWSLDLEGLDDAVGKKTKVVMVCNPNNPTGSVLTEDEMDAIVRVAERRGAGSWPTRSTGAPSSTPMSPRRRSGVATTRSSSRAACRRRSPFPGSAWAGWWHPPR